MAEKSEYGDFLKRGIDMQLKNKNVLVTGGGRIYRQPFDRGAC